MFRRVFLKFTRFAPQKPGRDSHCAEEPAKQRFLLCAKGRVFSPLGTRLACGAIAM